MLLMFCLNATLNVTFIIFRYAPVAQNTNPCFQQYGLLRSHFLQKIKKSVLMAHTYDQEYVEGNV